MIAAESPRNSLVVAFLREEPRVSQREVAAELDVWETYLSALLRGHRDRLVPATAGGLREVVEAAIAIKQRRGASDEQLVFEGVTA